MRLAWIVGIVLLAIASAAEAGTRSNPDVSDPTGDVVDPNGEPLAGPEVAESDIHSLWVLEDDDHIFVHLRALNVDAEPLFREGFTGRQWRIQWHALDGDWLLEIGRSSTTHATLQLVAYEGAVANGGALHSADGQLSVRVDSTANEIVVGFPRAFALDVNELRRTFEFAKGTTLHDLRASSFEGAASSRNVVQFNCLPCDRLDMTRAGRTTTIGIGVSNPHVHVFGPTATTSDVTFKVLVTHPEATARLVASVPEGWTVSPASYDIAHEDSLQSISFDVQGDGLGAVTVHGGAAPATMLVGVPEITALPLGPLEGPYADALHLQGVPGATPAFLGGAAASITPDLIEVTAAGMTHIGTWSSEPLQAPLVIDAAAARLTLDGGTPYALLGPGPLPTTHDAEGLLALSGSIKDGVAHLEGAGPVMLSAGDVLEIAWFVDAQGPVRAQAFSTTTPADLTFQGRVPAPSVAQEGHSATVAAAAPWGGTQTAIPVAESTQSAEGELITTATHTFRRDGEAVTIEVTAASSDVPYEVIAHIGSATKRAAGDSPTKTIHLGPLELGDATTIVVELQSQAITRQPYTITVESGPQVMAKHVLQIANDAPTPATANVDLGNQRVTVALGPTILTPEEPTGGTGAWYAPLYAAGQAHVQDYDEAWQQADAGRLTRDGPLLQPVRAVLGDSVEVRGTEYIFQQGAYALRQGMSSVAWPDTILFNGQPTPDIFAAQDHPSGIIEAGQRGFAATRSATHQEGTPHADVRVVVQGDSTDTFATTLAATLAPGPWMAWPVADGVQVMPTPQATGLELRVPWIVSFDPYSTTVHGIVFSPDLDHLVIGDKQSIAATYVADARLEAGALLFAYDVPSPTDTHYAAIFALDRLTRETHGVATLDGDASLAQAWPGRTTALELEASKTLLGAWRYALDVAPEGPVALVTFVPGDLSINDAPSVTVGETHASPTAKVASFSVAIVFAVGGLLAWLLRPRGPRL